MFQLLRARLNQNHGVITAGEARDRGLTPSEITALVHGGSLVRVRRGVYADGEVWRAADEFHGRPLLRVRAAVACLQRGWVLSHDSAALVLGLPLIAPHESDVHVTRPGYAQSWPRAGIVRHYASYVEEHVVRDGDLPHLDAARTAVDLAREHGVEAGLVACDAALRAGVSTAALRAAYQPMSYYPGVITARRAVSLADPRAESAAESLARLLVVELGIGDVDAQFPVRIEDGRTVWCDLRVGNHVFEVDGRWKYRSQADGGVAARPAETVIWEEKKRARLVRARGLGLSEIVWEDLWGDRRERALERLRSEYLVTEQRFGPVLADELARQAQEIRRRQGTRSGRAEKPA